MRTLKKILLTSAAIFALQFSSIANAAQKDILILVSDGAVLSKSTNLYEFNDWYMDKRDHPRHVDELLKEGWSLLQIVSLNSQTNLNHWVFVK